MIAQSNKIYNYDCLDFLNLIPHGSIDLIFADPPYNLGKDFGNLSDKQEWGEYIRWTYLWVTSYWELLKPTASLYITISPHPWLITLFLDILSDKRPRLIAWCKNTGMLHKYAKEWEWFWEVVVCVRKSSIFTYNKPDGTEARDWWVIPTPWVEHHNRWFKHPSQKPEKLLEKIISSSTIENDLVLDPFMGSGTTAVAAKKLGRNFIGCEINPEYIEIANKRLEQMKLL